jgi:hypothetical protein
LADDALAHGKGPIRVISPWVTVTADEAEALSSFIQQEEGPAQSLQHGDELRHEAPREFVGGVGSLEEAGDFGEYGLDAALRFALVGGAAVGLEGASHLTDFGLVLLVADGDTLLVGEQVAEAFIESGDRIDDAFAIEEEERADGGGYGGEQCAQSDVGQDLGAKGQVSCLGREAGFQRAPAFRNWLYDGGLGCAVLLSINQRDRGREILPACGLESAVLE